MKYFVGMAMTLVVMMLCEALGVGCVPGTLLEILGTYVIPHSGDVLFTAIAHFLGAVLAAYVVWKVTHTDPSA